MKKICAWLFATMFAVFLSACNDNFAVSDEKLNDYKVGIGSYTTTEDSYGYTDEKNGRGTVSTTYVAAVFDKDGKIVKTHVDEVETKLYFDGSGQLADYSGTEVKSKREMGDDYGMKKYSDIGKEWYEQADSLEKWLTGQDVNTLIGGGEGKISSTAKSANSQSTLPNGDDIPYNANGTLGGNVPNSVTDFITDGADDIINGAENIADGITDGIDNVLPDMSMWADEDLKSSVTIDTSKVQKALEKAYKNAK